MGKFPWRHRLRTEILVGSKNGLERARYVGVISIARKESKVAFCRC